MSDRGGSAMGARAAVVVAIIGVILLVGMIARELFFHPRVVADAASHEPDPIVAPSAAAPPAPVPTSSAVASIAHAAVAVDAPKPSPSSSAGPALDASSQLAAVIADPRAMRPQNVVPDRAKHQEEYAFEVVAPFRSMQLTKDTTNANAWRLEGLNGPPLAELGATKVATVQKGADGDDFATWYAIDSGPLAPAYAAKIGGQTRIVSRAFLEANKSDYPPSVTQVLDSH